MLICIGLLTGIRDEHTLIMIGVLCAACQISGLLAEYSDSWRRTLHHAQGWVMLMTAYGIIWTYYGIAVVQAPVGYGAPDFVHAIVITMFILFNSFGIIQLTQMYCRPKNGEDNCFYKWVGKEAEVSYVAMSLVAKTVLGWVIYAQVIVTAEKC